VVLVSFPARTDFCKRSLSVRVIEFWTPPISPLPYGFAFSCLTVRFSFSFPLFFMITVRHSFFLLLSSWYFISPLLFAAHSCSLPTICLYSRQHYRSAFSDVKRCLCPGEVFDVLGGCAVFSPPVRTVESLYGARPSLDCQSLFLDFMLDPPRTLCVSHPFAVVVYTPWISFLFESFFHTQLRRAFFFDEEPIFARFFPVFLLVSSSSCRQRATTRHPFIFPFFFSFS